MNHPLVFQHVQRSSSYTSDHTEKYDDNDDDDTCITVNPMMVPMSHVNRSSNAIDPRKQTTSSDVLSDLMDMTSPIDYMTLKKQKYKDSNQINKNVNKSTSCRSKQHLSDDIDVSTDVDDDDDVGVDDVKEDKVKNDINSIFDFLIPKMNIEEYSKKRRLHDVSNINDVNRIVIDHHSIEIAIEHNRINMKYDAIEDKKHEQFDHNIKTIAFIDSFKDHFSNLDYTLASSMSLSTSLLPLQPSLASNLLATTTIINDANSDDNAVNDDLRLSPTTFLASQIDTMSITSDQSNEDLLKYIIVTSNDYESLID